MISEQDALQLFKSLKEAEANYDNNPIQSNKLKLDTAQASIVEKLSYMVKMKSSRYKQFSNYEDLNQDGLEALIKGLKTYKVEKGSIFWWLHKYIDTKIYRSANKHTTIKFPLKLAKSQAPRQEQLTSKSLKIQSDTVLIEPLIEDRQVINKVSEICDGFTSQQKTILFDHFGLTDKMQDSKSIKQISLENNMSKKLVEASIKNSLEKIKTIIV